MYSTELICSTNFHCPNESLLKSGFLEGYRIEKCCHWAHNVYTKSIHRERIGIKMRIKNGVRTKCEYGNKMEIMETGQLLKWNGK